MAVVLRFLMIIVSPFADLAKQSGGRIHLYHSLRISHCTIGYYNVNIYICFCFVFVFLIIGSNDVVELL